jgi:tetratricopeptide (TPR) repeat protein
MAGANGLQSLLNESNIEKASANALFAKSEFKEALEGYDTALSTCPNYLDYEVAVLKSNIAACHLKLENWKEAVKAATAALDGLDRLQGKHGDGKEEAKEGFDGEGEEADEEIISEGATKAEDVSNKGQREADAERIRAKALMRRARARSEQGGWATLQGAEEGILFKLVFGFPSWHFEDYKTLSQIPNLSAADRKIVVRQLKELPPRTKAAQEKEMGEMMGKLKQVRLASSPQKHLTYS